MPASSPAVTRRGKTRHHVGAVGDFNAERFTVVQAGKEELGVLRTESGFHAMRNYCPHMGGKLCLGDVRGTMRALSPDEVVYDEEHLVIRCPWHRWEWALQDGSPIGRVTNLRAKVFEVEVADDQVFVYV